MLLIVTINAPINIMPSSPGRCQGRGENLTYAKFKCTTYRACSSIKSQHSPHLSHGDLWGDLLVNVHTSVHAYGERLNSPCIGRVWRQMLHLFSSISQEGGVVHNVHRCISVNPSSGCICNTMHSNDHAHLFLEYLLRLWNKPQKIIYFVVVHSMLNENSPISLTE